MKNTYKLKKGQYYYSNQDGKVSPINPLDVRYNGTTLGLQIDLYNELHKKYDDLQTKLDNAVLSIREFLNTNGIVTTSDDLKFLTSEIRRVKTIISGVEYYRLELDDDGYIKSVNGFSTLTDNIIDVCELPSDVTNGYYYISDDKVIKDEQKFKEYWELI